MIIKESYIKIKDIVLMILIIIDVILIFYTMFSSANPVLVSYIYSFDLALCLVLFIEFSFNLKNSKDKIDYIKSNWYDIIAFIPLDFLRTFRFIRIFKLLKILALFKKDLKKLTEFLGRTHLTEALTILVFTIVAGTLIFYFIEDGINNSVHNVYDALWYSLTTTLVGGGDITPITLNGRIITTILMIVGITFVGFLTASLASWAIINPEEEKKQHERLETMENSLKQLEKNMEELKELIEKKI